MKSDTSERGLEQLICAALTGAVCDPVAVPPDVERETSTAIGDAGWICGNPNDYDREYTVDLGLGSPDGLERVERGMTALGEGEDFLVVYYSSDRAGGWQPLNRPLRTMTTLDRFGLVQWINGEPTFRMLQVPELRRAMGLPRSYRLRYGTRRDKVRILGNGVCAPVMQHVVASLMKNHPTRSRALGNTEAKRVPRVHPRGELLRGDARDHGAKRVVV